MRKDYTYEISGRHFKASFYFMKELKIIQGTLPVNVTDEFVDDYMRMLIQSIKRGMSSKYKMKKLEEEWFR